MDQAIRRQCMHCALLYKYVRYPAHPLRARSCRQFFSQSDWLLTKLAQPSGPGSRRRPSSGPSHGAVSDGLQGRRFSGSLREATTLEALARAAASPLRPFVPSHSLLFTLSLLSPIYIRFIDSLSLSQASTSDFESIRRRFSIPARRDSQPRILSTSSAMSARARSSS